MGLIMALPLPIVSKLTGGPVSLSSYRLPIADSRGLCDQRGGRGDAGLCPALLTTVKLDVAIGARAPIAVIS